MTIWHVVAKYSKSFNLIQINTAKRTTFHMKIDMFSVFKNKKIIKFKNSDLNPLFELDHFLPVFFVGDRLAHRIFPVCSDPDLKISFFSFYSFILNENLTLI